jgi:GTPase SAR1 family protein
LRKDDLVFKICIIGRNNDLSLQFGRLRNLDGELSENLRETLGVDVLINRETLNNKDYNIRLVIMVLSSHPDRERLRSTYYQGSLSCIVLFDKAEVDYESDITYWVNDYRENGSDSNPIFVVGIKSSMEEEIDKKAKDLSEQLNASYYETIINDKEWVENFFSEIAIVLDKIYA